jgi:nitrous oxide reductase accessory protein NosL
MARVARRKRPRGKDRSAAALRAWTLAGIRYGAGMGASIAMPYHEKIDSPQRAQRTQRRIKMEIPKKD